MAAVPTDSPAPSMMVSKVATIRCDASSPPPEPLPSLAGASASTSSSNTMEGADFAAAWKTSLPERVSVQDLGSRDRGLRFKGLGLRMIRAGMLTRARCW